MWKSLALVVLVAAGAALFFLLPRFKNPTGGITNTMPSSTAVVFDPLNAAYTIDGSVVNLVNGSASEEAAPGSVEMIVTKVFGQPTVGDINGDGKADAAVILVRDGGGSGTFYYAVVAINNSEENVTGSGNSALGTNAIFLGDRIAPDTMQIANGIVTVNYADRTAGEPMSATPSVGVSKYLMVINNASNTNSGATLYDVPIGNAYPLASGISWGDMQLATTTIPAAAQNAQDAQDVLAGIKIISQPIANVTNLSALSLPFENYYQKKLSAAGWAVDKTIAAGGPGADVIGYKKGSDYIILTYSSVFKNSGGGVAPESCPCAITFSIFAGTLLP
jgi:hypothetical protein